MARGINAGRSVLIETYWNVNRDDRVRPGGHPQVLIETYWNVNAVACRRFGRPGTVLIETYWNVNDNLVADRLDSAGCINRNILECK